MIVFVNEHREKICVCVVCGVCVSARVILISDLGAPPVMTV